ncbi:MAG: hypothetical protein JWL81_1820 [Verrucomicrobiales bacterium]|nr:hypothetical protein [Verrucomicrobiales bacterium]
MTALQPLPGSLPVLPPQALSTFRRRTGQGGFSLIELLTTLSIFTMIGVLYSTVIDNISLSVNRSARHLDASATTRTLQTALNRDLHRLAPPAGPRPSFHFEQSPEETNLWLTLRASPSDAVGSLGKPMVICWQWQRSTGQIRRFDPAFGPPHSPANSGTLIASHLTGLTVSHAREIATAPALRFTLEFPSRSMPAGTPQPASWPMELLLPLPSY